MREGGQEKVGERETEIRERERERGRERERERKGGTGRERDRELERLAPNLKKKISSISSCFLTAPPR